MMRRREAPGGGRVVEVEPGRLIGWVGRFTAQHGPVDIAQPSLSTVTITSAGSSSASVAVPFPPLTVIDGEPLANVVDHIEKLGQIAVITVRSAAFSIGVCDSGNVMVSSTDTRYVQGRTAAGGWSQQRFARRRGNQRRQSHQAAADTAYRVLAAYRGHLAGLVVAGSLRPIESVLADARLEFLTELPRRTFLDIPEPRRSVLDDIAKRALTLEITIRDAPSTAEM